MEPRRDPQTVARARAGEPERFSPFHANPVSGPAEQSWGASEAVPSNSPSAFRVDACGLVDLDAGQAHVALCPERNRQLCDTRLYAWPEGLLRHTEDFRVRVDSATAYLDDADYGTENCDGADR